MSGGISRILGDSLRRECCRTDAWVVDDVFPDAEFTAYFGKLDYGSYLQKCGEFDLKKLRWRVTQSGVEISDVVVCEHFQTQSEWEREAFGEAGYNGSDDDTYFAYLEALEEGTWPISYVGLSVKMSHACLIEMLACRAEIGLIWDREISDSQYSQQWTDLFATLTMTMARLPAGQTKLSAAEMRSELVPLATRFGKGKWSPQFKQVVGKYNRLPSKKYWGFNLAV